MSGKVKGFGDLVQFLGIAFAAFIVFHLPFIHWPFSWFQTFFHELSHGIAAFVTGGSIERIELNLMGSGMCYTRGGIRFITAFSGYAGGILWGSLIYMMADELDERDTNIFAGIICGLVLIVAVLFGRDVVTFIIMGIIFSLMLSVTKLQNAVFVKWALKFIGLYILIDAIARPLNLIDGRHHGDGAALANITGIPEIFWVVIWWVMGLSALYYIYKSHVDDIDEEKTDKNDSFDF